MKRLLLALTIFLAFALPHAATAQDGDTASGWPVVERCVTPTVRPDGWTFDGVPLTVDTPVRIAYTLQRYHPHLDSKKGGRPVVGQVNGVQVVQHSPGSAGARL